MHFIQVSTALLIGVCVLSITVNLSLCDIDQNLINFIYKRIPELQGQARQTGRRQFAAIIFMDQTEVNDPEQFEFHPHHNDGTPYVDNSVPSMPQSPWNYMVARPNHPYHAEEYLLYGLPGMWNNYINQGTHDPPAMILLYSRLYPCTSDTPGQTHECAEQIREVLNQPPYNTVPLRIISYNNEEDSPVPNIPYEDYLFYSDNMLPQGLPMDQCFNSGHLHNTGVTKKKYDGCKKPSKIQTLQGCVLECLGSDEFTCVEKDHIDEQSAYLMNILMANCLLNKTMGDCFGRAFIDETGTACSGLNRQSVAERLVSCHQRCYQKPISMPQKLGSEYDVNIVLMSSTEERINYSVPASFGCKDSRQHGLLCTYANNSYRTAQNTLCMAGHPCGYYGYGYSWCYTSYDEWCYCCTNECGYQGYNYRWCKSGSSWQYCENGGTNKSDTESPKSSVTVTTKRK